MHSGLGLGPARGDGDRPEERALRQRQPRRLPCAGERRRARVNPVGIKGIGEIGIVGMNAAAADAVFNAAGRRIRDPPIRAQTLL
jgi:hypothetical protein